MNVREAAESGIADARKAIVELWRIAADDPALRQRSWQAFDKQWEVGRAYEQVLLGRAGARMPEVDDEHVVVLLRTADGFAAGVDEPRAQRVRSGSDEFWVRQRTRPITEGRTLGSAAPHHWVVPARIGTLPVRIVDLPALVDNDLASVVLSHGIGACAAAFQDGVTTELSPNDPFVAVGLDGPSGEDIRFASIRDLIEDCERARVSLVVLPELSVPSGVWRRVCEWLRARHRSAAPLEWVRLVVLGSFHVSDAGRVQNEATTVSRDGVVRHRHAKLLLHGADATDLGFGQRREGVAPGAAAVAVATIWGLIATPVGCEFGERNDPVISRLWHALAPDFVLVPAMGNQALYMRHEAAALDLFAAGRCVTIAAHQERDGCRVACHCVGTPDAGAVAATKSPVRGTVRGTWRI